MEKDRTNPIFKNDYNWIEANLAILLAKYSLHKRIATTSGDVTIYTKKVRKIRKVRARLLEAIEVRRNDSIGQSRGSVGTKTKPLYHYIRYMYTWWEKYYLYPIQ